MPSNNNDGSNDDKGGHPPNFLDPKFQEQLRERKDEVVLLERFKQIVTRRLEAMTRQTEDSDDTFKMGEEERKRIRQMNGMGLKEGVAAGILTFIVLRKGPLYVGRFVWNRRMAQRTNNGPMPGSGSAVTKQSNASNMPPLPRNSDGYQLSNPFVNATNPNFPRSRNPFIRAIWFSFDAVLSLMMGASVSIACTDTETIQQQIVDMPLIQGKSLIADSLCDDIVQELQSLREDPTYQRLSKYHQHGQSHVQTAPSASYLQAIEGFGENCQRRRLAERQFRLERGMGPGQQVEPPLAVPRDGPRLIVSQEGEKKVAEATSFTSEPVFGSDDGQGFDSFQDTDWAASAVDDSDIQDRNDRR